MLTQRRARCRRQAPCPYRISRGDRPSLRFRVALRVCGITPRAPRVDTGLAQLHCSFAYALFVLFGPNEPRVSCLLCQVFLLSSLPPIRSRSSAYTTQSDKPGSMMTSRTPVSWCTQPRRTRGRVLLSHSPRCRWQCRRPGCCPLPSAGMPPWLTTTYTYSPRPIPDSVRPLGPIGYVKLYSGVSVGRSYTVNTAGPVCTGE